MVLGGHLTFCRTRLLELGLELTILLSRVLSFLDRQYSGFRFVSSCSFLVGKDLAVNMFNGGMWLLRLGLAWKHHLTAVIKLAADLLSVWIRVQEFLIIINIGLLDSSLLTL